MKEQLTKVAGKATFLAKKYSPEILLGVGIVGLITGTAMVVSQKRKELLEFQLDLSTQTMDELRDAEEQEVISHGQFRKEAATTYTKLGLGIIKIYGPGVFVAGASIASLLASHNIMKTRNAALAAAYVAVDTAFNTYRERVVKDQGVDKDIEYRYGLKKELVEVVGEDGKKSKEEMYVATDDKAFDASQYSRFFDPLNDNWQQSAAWNRSFILGVQRMANDKLHARGFIFLNEVYEMLGFAPTTYGASVGWTLDGTGDNKVNFGIYDIRNKDFVNGYERCALLDFNVDGPIFQKIDQISKSRFHGYQG